MNVAPRRVLVGALCLALFARGADAANENLLKNGGFESGLDGWIVDADAATMTAEIDKKVRSSGKAALHLAKPATESNGPQRVSATLAKAPAGKRIAVTAQVRAKDLQNTFVKLFAYNEKGESLIEECDVVRLHGSFEWREIGAEFDLPTETTQVELRIAMFRGGELWVDEVKIANTGAAAKERVVVPAVPLDAPTRKWLETNAVVVKTLDFGAKYDDLRALSESLKDARIVQLGENTHGDGACFEAKARLVRFLHEELDFDVLAFESGMWECDRANDLLAKGDAGGAVRASIFPIWHTKPVNALFDYAADRARTKRPLILAGFDCRRSAGESNTFLSQLERSFGADAADVKALSALEASMWSQGDKYDPPAAELKAGLESWARLRVWLDSSREALDKKHGATEISFVSQCLDSWKSNEAFERAKKDEPTGKWDSTNLRDQTMAANLKWLADVRYPGKKIVTWGATFHLCRGIDRIDGAGVSYRDLKNMGGSVAAHFGKNVYTIGFAAHGGRAGTRFAPKPFDLELPGADSVEDVLHRFGKPYLFVDLRRAGPFADKVKMAPLGYSRSLAARWPDVLDGVFFIDQMTPAR